MEDKQIIVLVGKGKSTLTNMFKAEKIYFGWQGANNDADRIKKNCELFVVCIHLEDESQFKKLTAGIKRRSLMFKVSF